MKIKTETGAEALLKWKSTLYQPTALISWSLTSSTSPCEWCEWFGISCNDDNNIIMVSLSNSNLSGTLDHLNFNSFPYLLDLRLDKNDLYGNIPSWFNGSSTPSIMYLQLGNNNFNGSIPEAICEIKKLKVLDISGNHLIGNLPNCWTMMDNMKVLDLSNNHFSGMIPNSFSSFLSLEILHLNNNSFIGELPLLLKGYSNLLTLDLGENGFTGDIPTWFGGSFPSLQILRLRSNRFSGSIPTQLSFLPSLQLLNLANNELTGCIPANFSHLIALSTRQDEPYPFLKEYTEGFSIGWNKGDYRFGSGVNYVLNGIYLSNNNLSGQIPKELILLSGIRMLNLSTNQLIGTIPEAMENLQSLELLDLSNNRLSGTIPIGMSSLSSLDSFNISNNNLSGSIPKFSQLQTFDSSAYSGNMELCGAPLNKKCSPKESSHDEVSRQDNKNQNEDTEEIIWLCLSVALGFIVGFCVFCGTLISKRSWRIMYFHFIDNLQDRLWTRKDM